MSTNRRQFMQRSGLVAVTVAVPSWVLGCGGAPAAKEPAGGGGDTPPAGGGDTSAWDAKAAELEGTGVLTTEAPGKWDGKAGSHAPQVSFAPGKVNVMTKHPMTEEHWITVHYVRDQGGTIIGLKEYAGTDPEASTSFDLPEGTTEITAYSHCNKHDHWSTAGTVG